MHVTDWLANFSGYLKEISVFFTGLFAVMGLAGENKDKETGKLTAWGKTFLVLTIVSMGVGLIAQIQDNKDSDRLLKQTQQSLEQTQKSVHQMSRLIQAFEQPGVEISFDMNCSSDPFKEYCDAHAADMKRIEEGLTHGRSVDGTLDTADLPFGPRVEYDWTIYLFKEKRDYDAFIASKRPAGVKLADTAININLRNYVTPDVREPNLTVYGFGKDGIILYGAASNVQVALRTKKLIAISDLPGATLVLRGYLLGGLTPTSIVLTTPRGQRRSVTEFTPITVGAVRMFTYTFPAEPAADDD